MIRISTVIVVSQPLHMIPLHWIHSFVRSSKLIVINGKYSSSNPMRFARTSQSQARQYGRTFGRKWASAQSLWSAPFPPRCGRWLRAILYHLSFSILSSVLHIQDYTHIQTLTHYTHTLHTHILTHSLSHIRLNPNSHTYMYTLPHPHIYICMYEGNYGIEEDEINAVSSFARAPTAWAS